MCKFYGNPISEKSAMARIESRRLGLIINGEITSEQLNTIFYNFGILDFKWTRYEEITIIAIILSKRKKFTSMKAFQPYEVLSIQSFRSDELINDWYTDQYNNLVNIYQNNINKDNIII